MRLLLDSHVLIAVADHDLSRLDRDIRQAVLDDRNTFYASAASLWEIAIKTRLGKLLLRVPVLELAEVLETADIAVLSVEARHALTEVAPEPHTRDPFDRMLLAQSAVENLRLVTMDRALSEHPLVWRP
jgi:PIN domain nuclease of toxin-antitoxin system